jgi:hypothetical protein
VNAQHPTLAAGRWHTFSFLEQMAHVGGEVERALIWQEKGNPAYSLLAFERALELLGLTLDDPRNPARASELARLHEALVDFFQGSNRFGSSDSGLRKYFGAFAYAARKDR